MTDRNDVEQVMRDAYAARAAGDLETLMRIFSPEASFELAGSASTFPGAVRVQGERDLRASLSALIAAFDFLEHTMLDSVIEGNKAAVRWRVRLRHNPSGEVHETELFDLWTIDRGRVASLVQFCDTALAGRLLASQAG